jgi:periplasmic divalent cation tolerance protein
MGRADPDVRVVLTMVPDASLGEMLARKLIEERLAACVNVIPGARSLYRWQGQVQDDAEVLMLIKTTGKRCAELADRINELHPYDVPEVLVLPAAGGSASYLGWVATETDS